jgi:hypothetical protein
MFNPALALLPLARALVAPESAITGFLPRQRTFGGSPHNVVGYRRQMGARLALLPAPLLAPIPLIGPRVPPSLPMFCLLVL